jgi:hypothetical protein
VSRSRIDLVSLILLCAAVLFAFLFHYVIYGTSIFQLNSIAASPILFLKIGYDRIRDLDFAPPMWTMLYGAGGPLAVGPSTFNPFLLLVSWIKPFEHALIAYEILLRVFGLVGCYAFLRRNDIGLLAALAASALFAFNVFSSSAGQDPQIGLSTFALPWVLLAVQSIVQRPSWLSAFGLSGAVALFHFLSTTQVFGYTLFILVLPFFVVLGAKALTGDVSSLMSESARLLFYVIAAAVMMLTLTSFDLVQQMRNLLVSLTSVGFPGVISDYLLVAPLAALMAVLLFWAVSGVSFRRRLAGMLGILLGYWSVLKFSQIGLSTIVSADFTRVSMDASCVRFAEPALLF